MSGNRDAAVLEKILIYCAEIDDAVNQFGLSLDKLQSNSAYKNKEASDSP
jgi:hypothetical protein